MNKTVQAALIREALVKAKEIILDARWNFPNEPKPAEVSIAERVIEARRKIVRRWERKQETRRNRHVRKLERELAGARKVYAFGDNAKALAALETFIKKYGRGKR